MSRHGKSDPARPAVAWKTIERVADQAGRDEMEQLLAMSPEELDQELEGAGFGPDDAANLVKAALAASPAVVPAAPAPAPLPVVDLAAERRKRRPSVGWLALVAAIAAVVIGGGGAAVVALRDPGPAPTTPAPTLDTAPPPPPPEQLAKQQAGEQRRRATAECADEQWGACLEDLRTAAALDPAGDEVRATRRLRRKATLGMRDVDAKPGSLLPRSLAGADRARFVKTLGSRRGQPLRLACAPGAEPQQLCAQMASTLTTLGWVVTRATDTSAPHGIRVEVAPAADDATQDAADALADALESAYLKARGPDDAPAGEPGLTLTVGPQ